MVVDALGCDDDPDALDLRALGVEAHVVRRRTGEALLLRQGLRTLRLDARTGTFLDGAVRLRYSIEGIRNLGHQLLTLRRLVALRRLGRLPSSLYPIERRVDRWILVLRVLDAVSAGASQKQMAEALFGPARVLSDWRSNSDYLRLRVQRLVRTGTALVGGGYRSVLKQGESI